MVTLMVIKKEILILTSKILTMLKVLPITLKIYKYMVMLKYDEYTENIYMCIM